MDQSWEFFDRATEAVYPSKETFKKALTAGKKLKIYLGIDPTGPDIHLGHSTNFLLLKLFQQAGHKIILLVGDFTATIGDPSGRTTARKPLTKKEIAGNVKTYKEQAAKIIRFTYPNPAEFKFNSEWLDKFTSREFIQLAATTTIQQLVERDMFQKRIRAGKPISAHEFLYPLLQGYDSVAMDIDLEVGGTDQTFNMLVGRELMKRYKNKEKFVITTKLLINPKTGRKLMSKSEGNYISLQDKPDVMYGKVMAVPDEVIFECFNLCTMLSNGEIQKLKKLKMLEAKKRLAFELVKLYHSEADAEKAKSEFERVFQKRQFPKTIPIVRTKKRQHQLLNLLAATKLLESKSEAKRQILSGAVEINGEKITDPAALLTVNGELNIKVGKRKFIKVVGE